MIAAKDLTVIHHNHKALNNASFSIPKGRITSFIGPSGAGKTTLLRCIAQLISTYEGELFFEGRSLREFSRIERVRAIGFVFQQFNLFPHFSVLENCTHPLINVLGIEPGAAHKRALAVLDSLQMAQFQAKFPRNLSGGQQQRVALARTLCLEPSVLLFDEPTSSLDPESSQAVHNILKDLVKRGYTVATSSHDMPFLRKIIDNIYFLRQGEIIEQYDITSGHLLNEAGPIAQFLQD